MSRDDYAQQGKQFVNDLRDTVSKKVAENEETILGGIGKAARWVDQKTGGKYSDRIGKAEAKVGEGVGWAAKQGSGEPHAPGAAAGEGTGPAADAAEPATGPVGPPTATPGTPPQSTPPEPGGPTRPTHPPRDDAADRLRPPQ